MGSIWDCTLSHSWPNPRRRRWPRLYRRVLSLVGLFISPKHIQGTETTVFLRSHIIVIFHCSCSPQFDCCSLFDKSQRNAKKEYPCVLSHPFNVSFTIHLTHLKVHLKNRTHQLNTPTTVFIGLLLTIIIAHADGDDSEFNCCPICQRLCV